MHTDNLGNSKASRWQQVLDVAIVLVVYAYNLPVAFSTRDEATPLAAIPLIYAAVCLPFLWRRRYSQAVFYVTAACVSLHLLLGMGPAVADVMLVFTLCSLTVRTRWQATIIPVLVTIALIVAATYEPFIAGYLSIGEIGFVIVATLLAYSWATVLRIYRQYIDSLRQRAIDAEQAQQAREQMIMAEERKRIARQLHDVVSHSLSSMIALSEGALATTRSNPEQSQRAIEQINSTGRSALNEMRTILTLLRSDTQGMLAPQPSIANIGELIESVRAAGVDIVFRSEGEFSDLSPGLQLTVYRVLQESLTNVVKHAGTTCTVRVDIQRTPEQLVIVVVNTVAEQSMDPALPVSGLGIQGMRERVHAFGGDVQAGPTADGGFQVIVRLPLGDIQ